jgi:methionyl-tRNA formyltransferase
MATVFLGTSEFAATVLGRLAADAHERPALVITRPDRPSGRGRRLTAPPVADRARELGLPLEQPADVNAPDACELIANAGGRRGRHTVVVCAFGALIREPLLSDHELVNVHPSLLPRWRGAAPIERALMAGDERTGVSIMRLTAGLDSGPVFLQRSEPVRSDDTYGSLAARLAELSGELLLTVLRERPAPGDQPEGGVTYAEKITAEDRLLDPARPAVELERSVRALTPHIGARAELPGGELLGVSGAALAADADDAAPGLQVRGDHLLLGCSPGALELLRVKPAGGREMDGADYVRGRGERL